MNILFEDKDIIVVVKPPKVPSQPDKTGDIDMTTIVYNYLKRRKKEQFVGIINRLDRPVSGIMIFGKNKDITARLSKKINEINKKYLIVACGKFDETCGEFEDYLLKNGKTNTSLVVQKSVNNAKLAKLSYNVLECVNHEQHGYLSLVSVLLETGRHHQIRVQFASRKLPLFADFKYNNEFKQNKNFDIALFCYYMDFKHPKTNKILSFEISPEAYPFDLFEHFNDLKNNV